VLVLEGPAASGATVDCNGAVLDGGPGTVNAGKDMVQIRSDRFFKRPTDVTVRECRIFGSVRVWGMGRNGEASALLAPSRQAGYVELVRNNAPTRVLLEDLTITAHGRIPLYLAPGVTHTVLRDSELRGRSDAVAVYLDAESAGNTMRANYIHTETDRELIAVDGSSENRILNNRFSALNHGGIYLYRNCGLKGTIRHSTPSNNTVINNVFFYKKYTGSNPSVYLGSRNGSVGYCDDDLRPGGSAFPYGSSISDLDYAQRNVVMQNQIYRRSIADMIRTGGIITFPFQYPLDFIPVLDTSSNEPNFVDHNETVSSAVDRRAGCSVKHHASVRLILDGELVRPSDDRTTPSLGWYQCVDGDLIPKADPAVTRW
jgi:parallel beta-helix repeat protein